ncbi:zinc finger B-box domain-containing protein 1 isoform X1 [Gallus gallus]|uniref:zinc finger B-box domain-containing protein 1 isoform X1 n=1 Tax=Gallus gallus TaxID=9031 RepID=UPI001AE70B38|nr:zinc finger B-box domain-containing protein 1 isoform X1 [Gallus gallus]XP_040535563.1 zinc finger B-box domain-containing protein 1 isoform X1 [Gallus gallus]XP_040535564.1 zinc finger B-box domain-containing protein 1 isoform X1 [Gallus gallus]XP_040535566.1 zinc finger B-box domain-containing protein 1 isoform X1 [Gallus gallus]XP_046780212.1 zinc finger B-box domain-containing protein 1 isoform X1 [Gallus gallus]XP_046780213.1 zinc finger B-box domain-containing protein 1 isoform X1 [Ga
MNNNNFVVLPGSKSVTSVRLKAKTVRELQLEKVQLEMENKEVEKKLRQLQSNMSREKEERKKSSAYHWKSGQAGPTLARFLSQNKEKSSKVSSGKVKLQLLKEPLQVSEKEPFKHGMSNYGAHEKSEAKEIVSHCPHTKNEGLTEASTRAGKLQVVDHFGFNSSMNETEINHEEKKVNSKHGVTSNKLSSLPESAGTAEELSSESDWTGLDNQDKGILLNGVFNEEESAKSFQEALIQWRNGNHDHRREQHAESVRNHEVQTSLSVMKENVQIQFKESGLSYMEKLLLKKYKRTSVDEMSASCLKDSRPELEPTALRKAVTGGEGKGDAGDTDDLRVEGLRRYWTSVFREEVPKSVTESAESTLKIEFLHDSYGVELEESCNFLASEAEATEMNNQRNIEPFEEFGRCEKRRDYFCSATGDQKSTLSNLLPKETAAMMRKSSCHSTLMPDTQNLLHSPPDGNLVSSKEILQGDGRWVTDTSLSEHADESVVEAVLESQMSRSSSGLNTCYQRRNSTCRSYSGNDSIRPQSMDVLQCKLTRNSPKNSHPRPKSSPMHTFRADTEISKHKYVDVIKQDEHCWEYIADQEALLCLEKELETYLRSQEKLYNLTSEDVTSSSRCSRKMYGNVTDFHKTLDLKDHSRADMLGVCDEDQIDDEEEILEDKRQVLALQ